MGVCAALFLSVLIGTAFDYVGDAYHFLLGQHQHDAYMIASEGKTYLTKDYAINMFNRRVSFRECGDNGDKISLVGSVSITTLTDDNAAVYSCYPEKQKADEEKQKEKAIQDSFRQKAVEGCIRRLDAKNSDHDHVVRACTDDPAVGGDQ
jgi:hypothetical protein